MAQELMVDVHGPEISVFVRGTCIKMTARKNNASWLVCTELRADDPGAIFTRDEFKALGPPLTIRPARWVGLCSRLKAPLRSIKNNDCRQGLIGTPRG